MAVTEERPEPPDTRGGSAPLPLGVFAIGIAALTTVLGGTFAVQIFWAVYGGDLTPRCEAGLFSEQLQEFIRGAEGVCHIVEGVDSAWETAVLFLGVLFGAVAIVVGFSAYKRMTSKRMREQCIGGAVLGIQAFAIAALILWFRSGDTLVFVRNFLNFELLSDSLSGFVLGARNTLLMAFGGELGGIIIGLLLAVLALSSRRVVRAPARVYINFFRGTPLLWQLSFFYFGIVLGLGVRVSTFQLAVLVFSLNTGAYAAEVFRAGIQSIERGQMEAARSLGMSYLQAMRYAIVPQAVRRVIPPLMNEFVILIKDTALILVLGILATELDIYNFARQEYADSGNATFFLAAAAGYLVVTLPLIRLVNAVEKRLQSGLVGVVGA